MQNAARVQKYNSEVCKKDCKDWGNEYYKEGRRAFYHSTTEAKSIIL